MTTYNEAEWRRVYSTPGGIAVCDDERWLLNGCPKCGCKKWTVSNDYYAYCEGCYAGFPTSYPITSAPLSLFDDEGVHCWRCNGFGGNCEGCSGSRTRPMDTREAPPERKRGK